MCVPRPARQCRCGAQCICITNISISRRGLEYTPRCVCASALPAPASELFSGEPGPLAQGRGRETLRDTERDRERERERELPLDALLLYESVFTKRESSSSIARGLLVVATVIVHSESERLDSDFEGEDAAASVLEPVSGLGGLVAAARGAARGAAEGAARGAGGGRAGGGVVRTRSER